MAEDKSEDDVPAPKGGGLMSILPVAVIAAAACFGMVWWVAAPQPVDEKACEAIFAKLNEEPPEVVSPEELAARAARYITLDTMTLSLAPESGAKHLRVTISLGMPADSRELSEAEYLRLRDKFMERLRTVDTAMITDPEAMPTLKSKLLEQARSVLGRDSVYSVLVTDFLMQ